MQYSQIKKSKEDKLGNHQRMNIRNGIDATNTSPVESCKKASKYSSHSIHSNMNLDTTCGRVLSGTDSQIQLQCNDAKKEILHNNYASRSETKAISVRKGQYLIDRYHDSRFCYKCVQVDCSFLVCVVF